MVADPKSSRRTPGLLQQVQFQTMILEPTQDIRRIILANISNNSHVSAEVAGSTRNEQRAASGGDSNRLFLDQFVQSRVTAYSDVHYAGPARSEPAARG